MPCSRAKATFATPEQVASRTQQEANDILDKLAEWWKELDLANSETSAPPNDLGAQGIAPQIQGPQVSLGPAGTDSKKNPPNGQVSKRAGDKTKTASATQAPGDASATQTPPAQRARPQPQLRPAEGTTETPGGPKATAPKAQSVLNWKPGQPPTSVERVWKKFVPGFRFKVTPQVRSTHNTAPTVTHARTAAPNPKHRPDPPGTSGIARTVASNYKRRLAQPPATSGVAHTWVHRNPSRRAGLLTRDVHRAPPRSIQYHPVPAPISQATTDAGSSGQERQTSPPKTREERAMVLQARRDKAASKKKEMEDRRRASADKDKDQAAASQAPPESAVTAAQSSGREADMTNTAQREPEATVVASGSASIRPGYESSSDENDLATFMARRQRAVRRRRARRDDSGDSEEDRMILHLARKRDATRRREMEALRNVGPDPDFRPDFGIRTRPILRTRDAESSKEEGTAEGAGGLVSAQAPSAESASTLDPPMGDIEMPEAQAAPSVEPATMTGPSMGDVEMADVPGAQPAPVAQTEATPDAEVEGQTHGQTQHAPVAQPEATQDTDMEGQTQVFPQAPTQDSEIVVPDMAENITDAAPVPYDINALFPNDPPGSNPIAGWPLENVAHPPANFREIQYPGLPDAIQPFSRDQTAHLRAIIPPYVRQMVEAQPQLPPLTLSGATRTWGPEPE